MKFSMFVGQPSDILQQADEIFLRQKDLDMILDLVVKYPNKDYVIDVNESLQPLELSTLEACNQKISGEIYCALHDIYGYQACKDHNLKYFYAFPVNSFFELKALKELGVSYVRLGMPIFFQMKDVSSFGIPVRLTPNKAYDAYIPRSDGVCGQWVRPEDLPLYEQYGATICEFRSFEAPVENHLIYERTMLHIYKDRKEWPGRLADLVKDLGNDAYNSLLEEDIGEHRLNCKQICQLGRCHYCQNAMSLSNTTLKYYDENFKS